MLSWGARVDEGQNDKETGEKERKAVRKKEKNCLEKKCFHCQSSCSEREEERTQAVDHIFIKRSIHAGIYL